MLSYNQLLEKLGRRPSGDIVFNKRIDSVPVKVFKERAGFVVYIDGDRLDAYKTQAEAEKMAETFVKQYKG